MISFNLHLTWYEAVIAEKCLDSLLLAIKFAENFGPGPRVDICLNSQTYLEKPIEGEAEDMWNLILDHPVFSFAEITRKTDKDPFYNIADWRREMYDPKAFYTVWGETDAIMPRDFFYILYTLQGVSFAHEPHILSFASRPMWDDTWEPVTHRALRGYTKPCRCGDIHESKCIELLSAPLKYKDVIDQTALDEFNRQHPITIERLRDIKIDGALLCLSKGLPTPFIAPDMHFVREDTCAAMVFQAKNIPQYCITTRLKGHNYKDPEKRTNTNATRNDEIFRLYAEDSNRAMIRFLQTL